MSDSDFPFIISSGPRLGKDPKIRTLIRKQAMKDVGIARKKKGNYGKVNLRQVPEFAETNAQVEAVVDSDSSREGSATVGLESSRTLGSDQLVEDADYGEIISQKKKSITKKPSRRTKVEQDILSFPAINLFSQYETARAKFQVDLADLSVLTNFNVTRSAIPVLAAHPSRLAELLRYKQWSYLEFVPSRYGTSACVTAATNCVLGKVKDKLAPVEACKPIVLNLYAKALHTLQEAISPEDSWLDADVLCAIQLLSLHELLDPTHDSAYSHHINGSMRLIRRRSTLRFETEFEKALFTAHVGPLTSEALMKDEHCYLEEPEWTALYHSVAQDTDYLHNRSSLTIKIRSQMFPLSGLWHDVGDVVSGPKLFDDAALTGLEVRCRALHSSLLDCLEDYKGHCVSMSLTAPPQEEITLRRELFGAMLECLCIVKRLLATVCNESRIKLETECHALSYLLIELQKQTCVRLSWLFCEHEIGVAHSILRTKTEWESPDIDKSDYERRIASRKRYNTWSAMLRSTAPHDINRA